MIDLSICTLNGGGSLTLERLAESFYDHMIPQLPTFCNSWKWHILVQGTKGADGEEVDAFIGDRPDSKKAFIVNQNVVNENGENTGKLDEHKVMLGFTNKADAKKAYLSNFEPNYLGLLRQVY